MTKTIWAAVLVIVTLTPLAYPQDIIGTVVGGAMPTIAIPDFRGSGDVARYMNTFNQTLFSAIQDSGLVKMAGKSFYPVVTPQQPSDFQQPGPGPVSGRRAPWLTDWSSPPVSAKYLAFGYAGSQSNQIVL